MDRVYFVRGHSYSSPGVFGKVYVYGAGEKPHPYEFPVCHELPPWLVERPLADLIELYLSGRMGQKPVVRVKAGGERT